MQNKYRRQVSLDGFGAVGQERLSNGVVALVGVGGVGCAALPLLIGAGVGRIMVFDCDIVSLHNLHRQTVYSESEVGRKKAHLSAENYFGFEVFQFAVRMRFLHRRHGFISVSPFDFLHLPGSENAACNGVRGRVCFPADLFWGRFLLGRYNFRSRSH